MSGSINKVILIGRLGKDPEIKSTANGNTVAKFSLATDEKFTDKSGQKQERTEWHNIVVWGKLADICGQYLRKGKLVYLEGGLRTDSWDDKETGQKKYRTEIVVQNMQMLGSKGEDGGSSGSYGSGGGARSSSSGPDDSHMDQDDEDVPF